MRFDHMAHVAAATGARMLFNSTLQGFDEDAGAKRLREIEKVASGRDLNGVAQVRGSGDLVGFQAIIPGSTEGWARLRGLAAADRLESIR